MARVLRCNRAAAKKARRGENGRLVASQLDGVDLPVTTYGAGADYMVWPMSGNEWPTTIVIVDNSESHGSAGRLLNKEADC